MNDNNSNMKYIVYGSNRVTKDFLYIFDNITVVAQLCDDVSIDEIQNVYENFYDAKIILCDFNHTIKEENLKSIGLSYMDDYIYEKDLFYTLDTIVVPKDKECYVWGTGKMAKYFLGEGPRISIKGFLDSNKKEDYFEGYPIFKPEILSNKPDVFVIVAVAKNKEILDYLQQLGFCENESFCTYDMLIGQPSIMLEKTIFDVHQYDIVCHTMLNHLEILSEGNTRCCCTTFVNQSLGNILRHPFESIWGSVLHKIMCLSIENQTYSFCNKNMCPLFVGATCNDITKCSNNVQEYLKPEMYPKVLVAGYDASCNLKCETCRKDFYYSKGKDCEILDEIVDVICRDYIKNTEFLILAGDGEVFASKYYEKLYMNELCNPKYIRLLTNGILFNEKNWNKLISNKKSKVMMTVSIDAASEETYEKIRRGGNFEVLTNNMTYASNLRKKGDLSYLRMNFVVQHDNYEEMPAFVEWGEKLAVDEIFFTKILNWGTYSDEEFSTVSMMEEDGVSPKSDLKRMLDLDIIKESKIVDLGTIQCGHKKDYNGVVYNYYMWELEKRGGKLFEL